MNDAPLVAAAHLLSRRVGLRLDPAIRGRLARCVKDGAAASGEAEQDYVARLDRDPDALQDLLNRITVQETSFFRHPDQFAALAQHVLGQLGDGPVRIWSAGCANGQEAYSLAMLLDESGRESWSIVASDVSTNAIGRARRGRYAERELGGLSTERRRRHLVAAGDGWEVVPRLRQRVEVLRHNLVSDPPPFDPGTASVVFCRNVLIYFRQEEVVTFLERLATWMAPGAWLFLGYSESLWQVTDSFQLVRVGDAFIYRVPPADREATNDPPRRTKTVASGPRARPRAARAPQPARAEPGAAKVPAAATSVAQAMAEGEAAMSAGDNLAAVAAFRRAAYLDPDQPTAHLNLGLAFEASGDRVAGRRAYSAARAALDRCDTAVVELTLEGYHVGELRRLLQIKLGGDA